MQLAAPEDVPDDFHAILPNPVNLVVEENGVVAISGCQLKLLPNLELGLGADL